MKKHFKPLFGIVVLTFLLVLPFFVFAQDPSVTEGGGGTPNFEEANTSSGKPLDMLNRVAGGGGFETDGVSLPSIAGMVVNAALSLLGIIFIIIIIVGGYKWMTAGGDENEVKTATSYIKRAIIGLVITLASWAIWEFIAIRLIF
jgi:hypothetical protein